MAEVVTSPNKALLPVQTTAERPEGSWPPPEMSATQNPLVPAGEFLVAEAGQASAASGLDALFAGTQEEVAERWSGSAVLTKGGEYLVVFTTEHTRMLPTVRIECHDGGVRGRGWQRDETWFKENAVDIFFGALKLPDGQGRSASHTVDGKTVFVTVGVPTTAPDDGKWATSLVTDGVAVPNELGVALFAAGAARTNVQALLTPEAPSGAPIPFGADDPATELAESLSQLGARSADTLSNTCGASELATALCLAVGRADLSPAATRLLQQPKAGAHARAGVVQRLKAAVVAYGGEWLAFVGHGAAALAAVDDAMRASWQSGGSVAVAMRGATRRAAQARQIATQNTTTTTAGRAGAGAPAASTALVSHTAGAAPNLAGGEAAHTAAAAGAAGGAARAAAGSDDDSSAHSDDDDTGEAAMAPAAATGPVPAPSGSLAVFAPAGSESLSAQAVLASLAAAAATTSLDPDAADATIQTAVARLGDVRAMLADSNGSRPLYPAVSPHASPGAADETERDVAALLAEARASGWVPRRPRDWLGAAARASELVQAVHHARGVAKAALTNASVKVPKSASSTISVAPSGDSDRARHTFYGAVAAEVVGTLASEAILLREASLTKSGHRKGEPIGVARGLVAEYGQPAGALLLSNCKAQGEIQGPGVAASVAGHHGHLASWLLGSLSHTVGKYKLTEAAADLKDVRDAIPPGMISMDIVKKIIRLLGGRQRTKQWTPCKGGIADGSWGSHLSVEDTRRAMPILARILGAYYGGVFNMPTGLGRGDDPSEAFGLVATVYAATDNLSLAQALEALVIAFESFQRDCAQYRTVLNAPLPDLAAALREVRRDVVAEMEKAQTTREQVLEQMQAQFAAIGASAGAGAKRLADGSPAPALAGAPAGAGATGDEAKLTKSQKDRKRKDAQKARKKLEPAKTQPGTPSGAPAAAPTAAPTATTTPTTTTGAGASSPQLLVSGPGYQLFAPPKPYGTDVEVCQAWGKAFYAGGTARTDEPCGWMGCFDRCQPKNGTCDRDHDLVRPAQLKAALKANCTERQAARFSA